MRSLNFSTRLFLSIFLLFTVFASCFIVFQYNREKTYKIELLNTQLKDMNIHIYEIIKYYGISDSILHYIANETVDNEKVRITLIMKNGEVIFDNYNANPELMENHSNRPEIQKAIKNGNGYTIARQSASSQNDTYFYSATYFRDKGLIIRSALPYDINLIKVLKADTRYVWTTMIMAILFLFIFYRYTNKIGKVMKQLKQFAVKAERNEDIENINIEFPHNELGEISNHIVQLYAQIKKSEEDKIRLKRQLTQNISHELKTPVSSIQGYLETLVNNPDMPENTKNQFITKCYNQANRLTSLLHDIFTLTRMDEANEQYEQTIFNLSKLIETIESESSLLLKDRQMQMLNLISPKIDINGNYSLIYGIFRNLTDNAINYAGIGTTITVKCIGESKDFYTISFSDNGVGVDKKHLPMLFERFYRVDKGRSRKLGGTGLGLAIVKNSVLIHGGTINVKLAETGGLEFVFTLPKDTKEDTEE